MSVIVEAMSVVVPTKVLDHKYPGGAAQYEADCPNRTFCSDGKLTRIGFMWRRDIQRWIDDLEHLGLIQLEDDCWVDMVVVDQMVGPTAHCPWIQWGRHPAGFTGVWMAGTSPGPVMCPINWKLGQEKEFHIVLQDEVDDRILPLQRIDNLAVVLDYKTGREMFIGRTSKD